MTREEVEHVCRVDPPQPGAGQESYASPQDQHCREFLARVLHHSGGHHDGCERKRRRKKSAAQDGHASEPLESLVNGLCAPLSYFLFQGLPASFFS